MEDKSNVRQNWYSIGTMIPTARGLVVFDILVRWNERVAVKKTDLGEETEYIYDTQRIDMMPPKEADVKEYLEKIKDDLLLKVQGMKLAAQAPLTSSARLEALESETKSMKSADRTVMA